ncbi:MAG: KilA-N domain-containing protein [Planctomycetota bacterium]|jgi:hypothetical protein
MSLDDGKLVFDGAVIRHNGEFICATDMWRKWVDDNPQLSEEEKRSKAPAQWIRKEGAPFVEFLAGNLNVPDRHIEVIRTVRGGKDPRTDMHWQAAMAYAKYLSSEFHAWCNEVVRAHMEGRHVPMGLGVQAAFMSMEQVEYFANRIVAPLEKRMEVGFTQTCLKIEHIELKFDGKFEGMSQELAILKDGHENFERKLALLSNAKRRELTRVTKADHCYASFRMGGMCPCCGIVMIVDAEGRKLPDAQFDHFYSSSRADINHTWLICAKCHAELTSGVVARSEREPEFKAYQQKRRRLPKRQVEMFN